MLRVREINKIYGQGSNCFEAIESVSFDVSHGEFVCVVGPSGAGKTTLLKCLCGLLETTSGSIELDGRLITSPPDEMALVFQDYSRSLPPWLTVHKNVTFPLRALPKAERNERATLALAEVGLSDAAHKYPWQLSGGMQQRVAIARALAYRPRIMLMDEPFGSVDAQTRADLEDLVLQVFDDHDTTVLLVTHDIDEAVYLADRVIVLSSSPATVTDVIPIDLPRPRDQLATKAQPDFTELRTHIWSKIRTGDGGSAS